MKSRIHSFVATLILSGGLVTAAHAVTNPPQCVQNGLTIQCPIVVNAQTWYHLEPGQFLRLDNSPGGMSVQVNEVRPFSSVAGTWQETCVGIDGLDVFNPPPVPGVGEIGCTDKDPSESAYPTNLLRWDGATTALSLLPGHSLQIGINGNPTAAHDFLITVLPNVSGIQAWRQPKVDSLGFFFCNGGWQISPGSWQNGWRNTTGHNITLTGALIYATSGTTPNTHSVTAACLYIVGSDGVTTRVTYCTGMNTRGINNFPDQTVFPNEYVIGQAAHFCPTGGVWDWAAYFFVRDN